MRTDRCGALTMLILKPYSACSVTRGSLNISRDALPSAFVVLFPWVCVQSVARGCELIRGFSFPVYPVKMLQFSLPLPPRYQGGASGLASVNPEMDFPASNHLV